MADDAAVEAAARDWYDAYLAAGGLGVLADMDYASEVARWMLGEEGGDA